MDIPKVRFKQMLSSNDVSSLKTVRKELELLGQKDGLPEYMENLDTYINNMIRYKAYYAEDEVELQEPNPNDYTSTACTLFTIDAVICIVSGVVSLFNAKDPLEPYVGLAYIIIGISNLLVASMIGRHFRNQFLQAQVQYRGAKAQCEALNRLYNAVRVPDDEKLKERDELRNTLNSQKAWLLEQFDAVIA